MAYIHIWKVNHMKKLYYFSIHFFLIFVMCAGAPETKKDENAIDEGTGEIVEGRVTEENRPVVDEKIAQIDPSAYESKRDVLIKKYFVDDNTYVIICKGYPKAGLGGKEAMGTAKEAALINAQMLAKEMFNDRVDVITNGSAEKYVDAKGYAVIYYVIKFRGLKKNLREKIPY